MLLVKVFLAISAIKLIVAGAVLCNKNNKMYRTRYRKFLEKGGDVFMGVSYSSIEENNVTQRPTITKKIEADFASIQMPIAFATLRELAYININSATGSYHQSGFDLIQESFLKNYSFLGQGQVYVYKATTPVVTRPEIVFFHACRVANVSSGRLEVEKSILVLILGEIKNEKEMARNIAAKPMNMTVFKFKEFENQGYAICEHLKFYLNECVEPELKLWAVYAEVLICIAVCVVAVTCINKFPRDSPSQAEPEQVEPNRIQLDQSILSEIFNQTNQIAEEDVEE
jgi:hypothetical protein